MKVKDYQGYNWYINKYKVTHIEEMPSEDIGGIETETHIVYLDNGDCFEIKTFTNNGWVDWNELLDGGNL